jgi:hypothetical protein
MGQQKTVFSVGYVQNDYEEVFGTIEQVESKTVVGSEKSSFETPACHDISLGEQELN